MDSNVCVLGAGLSGLCTVKELKEVGLNVTCFEKSNGFGGALSKSSSSGKTYGSMLLTVSNYFMAYSALPVTSSEGRRYWTPHEYEMYLEKYVSTFSLAENIHYGMTVINVERREGGEGYVVTVKNLSGEVSQQYFHAVVVCTGTNRVPNQVCFPGQDKFKGEIIHTSQYQKLESLKGKRVVCIGGGESGVDIAHEVSAFAKSTSLITRDWPSVVARWINQYTNDAFTSRAFNELGVEFANSFMRFKAKWNLTFNNKLSKKERIYFQYVLNSPKFFNRFLTKNDTFIDDVAAGKLTHVVSEIETMEEDGLRLADGSFVEADIVIQNTGYAEDFSFINTISQFDSVRELYKHMIDPKIGPTLSFIGWARPAQGGVPACSEMQARYLAQLLVGNVSLPEHSELTRLIRVDRELEESMFSQSRQLKGLLNYHQFMHSMAELIGCSPKVKWYLEPELAYKMWFGSHLANFYRISGVGATPSESKYIIRKLPVASSFERTLVVSFLLAAARVSRLFSKNNNQTLAN
ncbi:NAD(P)-binding domain-containing protein [Pseudoalteromonas sp. 2CM41L]|uniref:flavin-containing monooxygenase n=1 Tax=Pseudoalteromonas sp. 2CM41L TaxID=2929857 RepID=UPI0020C0AB3C|nr:NAD(P)-binding domain-containing protein [Pseudoalteromonas sp. 2CM41L]MCK8109053.1 NAD(P)-binding domain-containing protein [Pseudoalteromonas sp. 2CM41L]